MPYSLEGYFTSVGGVGEWPDAHSVTQSHSQSSGRTHRSVREAELTARARLLKCVSNNYANCARWSVVTALVGHCAPCAQPLCSCLGTTPTAHQKPHKHCANCACWHCSYRSKHYAKALARRGTHHTSTAQMRLPSGVHITLALRNCARRHGSSRPKHCANALTGHGTHRATHSLIGNSQSCPPLTNLQRCTESFTGYMHKKKPL